ncbi:RNA recognition motif-containing protein [Bachmanniomyces sp. S44760]|nr:RNA recognition motif-containing protein [Bachmanniomyces sp. S44760]
MASRKRQRVSVDDSAVPISVGIDEEGVEVQKETNTTPRLQRSLFIHSLPPTATSENLANLFSQSYPLKHATVVSDPATKLCKGYGFVTFVDAEDAGKAKGEFNGSIFDGRKIKVDIAEPRQREIDENGVGGHRKSQPSAAALQAKAKREDQKTHDLKPPKLIVRNLPWTIKDSTDLSNLFRSYGKVKHADLPKKKSGLLPGFGFVTLRGRKNAERALQGMNGKEIDGRTLAVDWAIEHDVWAQLQSKSDEDQKTDVESIKGITNNDDLESVKTEGQDGVNLDAVIASDAGQSDDSDVEDDDGEEEDNKEDEDNSKAGRTHGNSTTLFVRNLPFTTTDEILMHHFRHFGAVRYARVVLDQSTERPKGTAFVCFYNQDDADTCLREAPRSQAGPVKAKESMKGDKSMLAAKHSLLEDVDADQSGHYTFDGRVVQVSRAVDRHEALRLTHEGSSIRDQRDKDKRRLYLLSEGTISSNSPLHSTLAPSEVKMREDSLKQRQTLIRSNPTLHLSLTRLSIRNIPRNISSKDLKALAREAVVGFAKDRKEGARQQLSKEELSRGGESMRVAEKARKASGKGIVRQAKIVFEGREGSKVAEDSGAGRSRGYGFIEYSSHRWALMGLRWLNGYLVGQQTMQPGGSTASRNAMQESKKRLIVEFAIENAQVIGRRQEKEAKARERSKFVAERRAAGEISEPPTKTLQRDTIMARTRKGTKRKRDGSASNDRGSGLASIPTTKTRQIDTAEATDKKAKRQQIIGRKRMMRKVRKSVSK